MPVQRVLAEDSIFPIQKYDWNLLTKYDWNLLTQKLRDYIELVLQEVSDLFCK